MKNCMIITFTGVHHLVSEEQAEKIAMMPEDSSATLNGNLIVKKNVSDILSMDKYYESYPNKRPERLDIFKTLTGYGINGMIKYSRKNALDGMIKGLKNYISSDKYQGTPTPMELLVQMETKLASIVD